MFRSVLKVASGNNSEVRGDGVAVERCLACEADSVGTPGGEPLLSSPRPPSEIRSIAQYGRRPNQQAAPGNGQAICHCADRASRIPGTNALDQSIALGDSREPLV